ncbi:hypothetical protein FB563_4005 [Streptomyces puniciscabiei]|jgi:hypothetical protein|uniref:Secreted protein n=2 Tax=Streptomyces TaxID=1883 RepID=A0ABN4GH40_9ACTN|nr:MULTISPECIES: hypothetical protein [Streptomyces]AKJ13100.1 hypothetical protein ABB07_24610 [Streptomyces incarnatus]TQK98957.1 hypothetical protein FB563_4005 [Streptomyces puniciscabiei]
MHKLRKAAVLIAAVSSIGLVGGTAHAGGQEGGGKGGEGGRFSVLQSSNCKSHDLNLDVLGEVGILNGLLGNALNGEGDPGAQATHIGSTMGCNNSAF